MNFKSFWKIQFHGESFEKDRLSTIELKKVQDVIFELQKKGLPSSKIITELQRVNKKLSERWKAERAFWTEVKRDDTYGVADASDDLGVDKYQVILSPNACRLCRKKTEQGKKVFKGMDLEKSGYGHVPPFHPNCYCILIPEV